MDKEKEVAVAVGSCAAKTNATRLEKLGFKAASQTVEMAEALKRNLAIAYEHYRFVKKEKIDKFNSELYKKTLKDKNYQTLRFTPIESYRDIPPSHVLENLEQAIDRRCFDYFEVAHIVTEVKIPDPILFGCVAGCSDKFFIDQWDEDCKIEDILKENEG